MTKERAVTKKILLTRSIIFTKPHYSRDVVQVNNNTF